MGVVIKQKYQTLPNVSPVNVYPLSTIVLQRPKGIPVFPIPPPTLKSFYKMADSNFLFSFQNRQCFEKRVSFRVSFFKWFLNKFLI